MRITQKDSRKHIMLEPGDFFVSNQDVIISTLLGSCISACLYDPIHYVIGMNHFLMTYKGKLDKAKVCCLEPGKYGICAMDTLIDGMLKLGAQKEHLHAKIFGGGSMFKSFDECSMEDYCVGSNNCIFIREYLNDNKIKLVANDIGGDTGRMIHYYYDRFVVFVKKLKKTLNPKVTGKDKMFWNTAIKEQGIIYAPKTGLIA